MKRETDYGYEIKTVYSPGDIPGFEYQKDLGDPGSFPYTRGHQYQGYRGRMYARMAREEFKAKKEKSCQLLIAVHTC